MGKFLTQDEYIKRARGAHQDKYDYSKTVYVCAKDKVIIICPVHGEFKQKAGNHLSGRGCFKCNKDLQVRLVNSIFEG